jgi:hypothetical protein
LEATASRTSELRRVGLVTELPPSWWSQTRILIHALEQLAVSERRHLTNDSDNANERLPGKRRVGLVTELPPSWWSQTGFPAWSDIPVTGSFVCTLALRCKRNYLLREYRSMQESLSETTSSGAVPLRAHSNAWIKMRVFVREPLGA